MRWRTQLGSPVSYTHLDVYKRQDEKFGDFIAYLYRTFRKKEGSITLAAQNILLLKNMPSSIKDSIIINLSLIHIFCISKQQVSAYEGK